MLHDILIPCRIGNYYLYRKRILSFEITPMMIQGVLIEYAGKSIKIKNIQSILLKDFSVQTQANALKKIASNIGKYDEIITTLSSSAIIYKELKLPFIGRDALQMIVPYEVEPLLPFSLEEAVIDFIITKEDLGKKQSTLLVAAVRMQDLQTHMTLFEKAELPLHVVTIDIFALYEIYKAGISTVIVPQQPMQLPFDLKSSSVISLWHSLHAKFFKKPKIDTPISTSSPLEFQPKEAELFIDIGFDVVRILYFQDSVLTAIRMMPTGIYDIAQNVSQKTEQPYFDVMQNILSMQATDSFSTSLQDELKKLFEEIARTLLFFEKQDPAQYIIPHKIWFSGFATNRQEFIHQAQTFFSNNIKIIDNSTVIERLNIKLTTQDHVFSLISLALGLFVHLEENVNFLKSVAQKSNDSLLNKQLFAMICITSLSFGATFWRSSVILQEKEAAYNNSKRQFVQTIEQRMRLDLRGEKSIKTIVEKTEEKLKSEKALWFAFSAQQEHCVLEYLQDLSIQIDRSDIGLKINSMHLDCEKVSMNGSVKSFEALDIFEEELANLKSLQLIEKPRELSFALNFKPKDSQKEQV